MRSKAFRAAIGRSCGQHATAPLIERVSCNPSLVAQDEDYVKMIRLPVGGHVLGAEVVV